MPTGQQWAVRIGVGILGLYVALLLLAPLFLLPTGQLHPDTILGGVFLQILKSQDGPANAALGLVVPVLSAGSVTALWAERKGIWALTALGLACLGVLCAVILWYWMGDQDTGRDVWQACDINRHTCPERMFSSDADFSAALHAFLGSTWKSLATLVGVLLGLQLKPAEIN